jgi:hypothetical protein
MPVLDHETTVVWNDGSPAVRTDRFHRTSEIRRNDAPPDACPVCWTVYCRAMPRDRSKACVRCGDAARTAVPLAAIAAPPAPPKSSGFDIDDEEDAIEL